VIAEPFEEPSVVPFTVGRPTAVTVCNRRVKWEEESREEEEVEEEAADRARFAGWREEKMRKLPTGTIHQTERRKKSDAARFLW
jgi:hypothetical protein